MKILLVEDDEAIAAVLTKSLAAHHYIVDVVKDGEMGWTYGSTFEYDLIVLDVVLPKLDGIRLCQKLRQEGHTMPILLLTSQNSTTAKVQGLDAGADDYVVKPFDQAELTARIRALLRRGSANPLPLLSWGELLLNPGSCEVTYQNRPLVLTTKEYELLELLLRESQHVFSPEEILDRLWSSEEFPSEATVRSHIRRLRQKLNAAGAPQDFIATVHGRGYYLKATSGEATPVARDAGAPAVVQPSPAEPDPGEQYLTFLIETWRTTQPKSRQQVKELIAALQILQVHPQDDSTKQQAKQRAHQLAGTLGVFGLQVAMEQARQIEQALSLEPPLLSASVATLVAIATDLQHRVEQDRPDVLPLPRLSLPLLLILGEPSAFTQALTTQAAGARLRTVVQALEGGVESVDAAALQSLLDLETPPDVILLCLPEPPTTSQELQWQCLQAIAQHFPHLPIVMRGQCQQLGDRLEGLRRGAHRFLAASSSPEQTLAVVLQVLENTAASSVMIVDDDTAWLQSLPVLLKPWGFKVTTLADPQQFWTVLQAVTPDIVVLDIDMPQINGLELCQVLRSDPQWHHLPVLFLSGLTDTRTQSQAFTLGADDYLCKPVTSEYLVQRLRNRLQRVRSCSHKLGKLNA